MKNQEKTRYLLFCEPCAYKKILDTDKPEDAVQIKDSPVPGGIPRLDKNGKTVTSPSHIRCTKVKCPKCGRGVYLKKLPTVYSKSYQEIDERKRKEQEELERKKRIEDGTPIKYKPPDFIG